MSKNLKKVQFCEAALNDRAVAFEKISKNGYFSNFFHTMHGWVASQYFIAVLQYAHMEIPNHKVIGIYSSNFLLKDIKLGRSKKYGNT